MAHRLDDITDASPWDNHAEDHQAERVVINEHDDRIEVLEAAPGGGAPLSDLDPSPLDTLADPGISTEASRSDHVHPLPSATDVGADPAGTAAAAVAAHAGAGDPHPGYLTQAEGDTLYEDAGAAAAAVAAHEGAVDPHPTYLRQSEADALYDDDGAAAAVAAALTSHAGIVDGSVHGINTLIAAAIAALVASSPATLDTLNELAAALGDDPNFATTVTNALAGKQPLDSDLTSFAALAPADDDIVQRKAGAWTNRTPTQLLADIAAGIADLNARIAVQLNDALVGTRRAVDFVDSQTVAWTVADDSANERVTAQAAALLNRYGGVSVDGHSFTQLVGGDRSTNAWTFPRRLAAMLQIPESETYLWGRSAATVALARDYGNAGGFYPGWGGVLRVLAPSHRFGNIDNRALSTFKRGSRSLPTLNLIYYVTNEAGATNDNALGGYNYPLAELRPSFRDGLRSLISYRRAKRLLRLDDSSAWAFSGPASTALSHAIAGTFRKITANSQTATLTVPADAKAGDVITVAFVAGANAYGEVASPGYTSGGATLTLKDEARLGFFPTSYPFTIEVDSERLTVTGRSGGTYNNVFAVTGAADGTSAANHATNAPVRIAARTKVTASGTAGWTDEVVLGGRGALGGPQVVVLRKTLTAAMLGATVVFTSGNYLADPTVGVGIVGAWVEDRDPGHTLLFEDHRRGWPNAFHSDVVNTNALTLNGDLDTVAGEFTDVTVVELAAFIDNKTRAVIKAGSSLPAGDPAGTLRTITITPDSAAGTIITTGSVLRCRSESLLVTACTVNGADLDLTVSRGYDSSTIAARAAGTELFDTAVAGSDLLHPSAYGHLLITEKAIETLANATSGTQAARFNSGTYGTSRPRYRNPDNAGSGAPWYYLPGGPRGTLNSWVANEELAFPIRVDQLIHVDRLFAYVTSPNASNRSFVLTVRSLLEGLGELLDYGSVSYVGGGGAQTLEATVDVLLRPGIYWLGFMPLHALSGTFRSFTPLVDVPYSISQSAPADSANAISGYKYVHAGATPATGPLSPTGLSQASGGIPLIGYRAYAVGRD